MLPPSTQAAARWVKILLLAAIALFFTLVVFTNITFRNSSDTGGLDFLDAALSGPQLYTGTEAAPTFRTGQFSLSDSFNLTITPESTVPEPPTISLLALGILALGTLTHRRLSQN